MRTIPAPAAALGLAMLALPAMAQQSRSQRLAGQDERNAYNSVFVEGGGPGLLYSLNYERIVENDFGLRVGFSYESFSASAGGSSASASIVAIPVIASYLGLSSGNHVLELGAGATGIYANGAGSVTGLSASGSGMTALGTVLIGYRRQPMNGGFQFRIGMEVLVGKGLALSNPNPDSIGVLPWMYMSLGFTL